MRGTKLFEIAIDGHITTKSSRKNTEWNDRMETKFSTLDSFPLSRRIAIEAKFWIDSKRFRESGALDLDNLIKPVLDVMTKNNVIDDDASIFDLSITKFPTDGEQILHVVGWEWV